MTKQSLILYSCGSDLIVDFIEVCLKNTIEIEAIINNLDVTPDPDLQAIPLSEYDFAKKQAPFLVPLFTPRNRYLASREALGYHLTPFDLLSDRNNDLPLKFTCGVGCFINKGVVIGSHSRLGNYVLINRGACLGHHLVLEDYVSIGPGVTTGGGVTVKTGALIGTGAVILPGMTIGEHAVVGAGTVVAHNVKGHSVVMGNPAEPIRVNDNAF
ncbi:MAG: acetyltransferase [Anaerolineae bacterium]|nr:acetyltransferase [Anaerolineae bacterium]